MSEVPREPIVDDDEVVGHEHPDVTGGWLRPAVFGAMDGLVSNFALIMGVTGGGADPEPVILAGLAGLAAGAFSMAAGEYTSVATQAEYAVAQVAIEREEIENNSHAEERELVSMLGDLGLDEAVSREVAAQVHQNVDNAVRVHSRAEFGVDVDDLPSPILAAVSSFLSFAVGALIPLIPLLFGITSAVPTITASLVALFACGAVVTRLTDRPWWLGGLRQLVLGGLAAVLTFAVGSVVGQSIS